MTSSVWDITLWKSLLPKNRFFLIFVGFSPHFTYLYSDMTLKFSKCLINIQIWQINFIAQRFQNLFCFFCSASEKFAEDLSTDSLSQGCKMDCEKLPNCELRLRIANAKKSQFHNQHNSQVAIATFRLTQFDFLEGRNCEIAKNCEIGEKIIFVSRIQPILKKIKKIFWVIFNSKMRKSQFLATFRNHNLIFGPFYNSVLSGDKKIRNDIWTIGNERMFDKKG